ncbi:ABC transporter permease [Sciscionella marina]|uniref:ABC transporter permease n=1 Tax=Sciscionella marina TaxID=508770 RepID=UPI0003760872|nr:ABC transporter permease [Sciscionella marina]
MTRSRTSRNLLLLALIAGLVVIYFPLLVVVLNSFNADTTFGWPPVRFTLDWWGHAAGNSGAIDALVTSVEVGLIATVISLLLGTMAAFALQRYTFFGRDTVSLLLILPIALPGIVTGIALNNAFRTMLGVQLGFFTVVVAHSTFCIVTAFNNILARLRRSGTNLQQASMDLGANGFTTFRLITFPVLRSALLAGGLLAFALSFDEIIVTQFTIGAGMKTLPVWIMDNLARPNQAPVVNVVATVLILVSTIPVYLAQRLSGDTATGHR